MHPYSVLGWDSFFVAQVGATAALAGLLFVAISINLQQILKFPWLPALAGETFLVLAVALVISTLGLVLGQSSRLFGVEIVVIAGGAWVFTMISRRRAARVEMSKQGEGPRSWTVIGFQIAVLPFVVGGVSVIARWGGGLYWIVAGVVAVFMVVFINSWTLLVEIQR
jgi:modulator of FtsH protease